jgi:1-acyl-sn-glycerol-3-phosphate acyltransferase
MLGLVLGVLRGAIAFVLFGVNTAFWGMAVFLMGLVKLLWPAGRWRKRCVLIMAGLGDAWVVVNRSIWKLLVPTQLEVRGMPELRRDGRYLVIANHQSWTDILVLFVVFNGKSAFIRFFLKHVLLFVPFLGWGCWALEFPFMKRHTREYLARHPEKRNEDFETTRRSCRHYRHVPVTIANFIEGTRFTEKKHRLQASRYRNLLEPRTGGIAFVLASMGEQLDGIFDVTIVFPGRHHDVSFLEFLIGRIPRIVVVIRELPLVPRFNDREVISPGPRRNELKAWVRAIWDEKDLLLDEVKGG